LIWRNSTMHGPYSQVLYRPDWGRRGWWKSAPGAPGLGLRSADRTGDSRDGFDTPHRKRIILTCCGWAARSTCPWGSSWIERRG